MKYRTRTYYNATQRAEIWDRWQRGESMSSIGRLFDRESSSIYTLMEPTGGIRPSERKRSKLSLTLSERNGGYDNYRAIQSDKNAWVQALRPKQCKLSYNRQLASIVARKLKKSWSLSKSLVG